jgi:hypothetical protein
MTLADIRLLRTLINDSLDNLERLYNARSLEFPPLDESFMDNEAEALISDPEATQAINLTVSAAYQLINTVRHPFSTLSDVAGSVSMPLISWFSSNCVC